MKMAVEIINGEKVIGRPKALYADYPRKGPVASTATHYCPGCGHARKAGIPALQVILSIYANCWTTLRLQSLLKGFQSRISPI